MLWLSWFVVAEGAAPLDGVYPTDERPVVGSHPNRGELPLVGGTEAPLSADEVVALATLDPEEGALFIHCTGSLVQDDWVLTAAHCIVDIDKRAAAEGFDRVVVWGRNLVEDGPTEVIEWAAAHIDPAYDPELFTGDAALVALEVPHPDPTWAALRDEPVAPDAVGTRIEAFGFGATADFEEDLGIKRSAFLVVEAVEDEFLLTFTPASNLCSGDSGGPSFVETASGPEQIGINAFVAPGCVGGRGGHTRVDQHIDWIRSLVPGVVLDPADLPEDRRRRGDRDWTDFGANDAHAFGVTFEDGATAGDRSGCQTAPSPLGVGWVAMALVLRRRTRRPSMGSSHTAAAGPTRQAGGA